MSQLLHTVSPVRLGIGRQTCIIVINVKKCKMMIINRSKLDTRGDTETMAETESSLVGAK